MKRFDRVYAKIHLDRVEENMRAMQKNLTDGTKMIGVVKADGYGHGAVPIAKTIDPYVIGFAVATAEEGFQLRKHGITKGILVLGVTPHSIYERLIEEEICPAMFKLDSCKRLSDLAVEAGKKAGIHIAVDTGMSRIGLMPTEADADIVKEIASLPGIEIEGIFTHFARADETDKTSTMEQLRKFRMFIDMLKARGIEIPLCHCSNSAGIVDIKEANMDAVRAGITIYGLYPSEEVEKDLVPLKPVMELISFITYIKEIGPGIEVSYGGTFKTERTTRIGTVCIGYGDGYPRNMSGKGHVIVKGKKVPILGRVCMDQLMIDLTDVDDVEEWDEVTLLGRDGDEEITMEELAEACGGFHYEIPCVIGKRVPRLFVHSGRATGTMVCEDGMYEGV